KNLFLTAECKREHFGSWHLLFPQRSVSESILVPGTFCSLRPHRSPLARRPNRDPRQCPRRFGCDLDAGENPLSSPGPVRSAIAPPLACSKYRNIDISRRSWIAEKMSSVPLKPPGRRLLACPLSLL